MRLINLEGLCLRCLMNGVSVAGDGGFFIYLGDYDWCRLSAGVSAEGWWLENLHMLCPHAFRACS